MDTHTDHSGASASSYDAAEAGEDAGNAGRNERASSLAASPRQAKNTGSHQKTEEIRLVGEGALG